MMRTQPEPAMTKRTSLLKLTHTRIVLAGLLTLAVTTHAATYVVDRRHAAAADSNPGTLERPLLTISAAAERATAGDEVVVRPGLYRESVTLTNSGAPGRPIVFRSEEPRAAVISGSDAVTNWQEEALGTVSFPIPKTHRMPHLGGNPQWVYLDGEPLERADTRDRLIPGSFYQDLDTLRVYVSPPEGTDMGGGLLEYAHREGLFASNQPVDDIHIIGFSLIHNADWFRGKASVQITGDRWLVENNHISWASYRGGIYAQGAMQAVVRSNLVEWCGCQGVGAGRAADLLMEGNIVRYHNWRSFDWGSEGGGSKFVCTIDARHVGNEYAFNYGAGLWSDICNSGTIYEKNICHDNTVRSLFTEINWDNILQDNIVYNTGEGGICVSHSPGTLVRRNIVFNNGYGLALAGNYTRKNAHDDTQWASNAVRQMSAYLPGLSPERLLQWEAGFIKYFVAPRAMMINNCVVRENIFFDNCRAIMENRDYRTPSPIDAFVNNFSDYNIFWAPEKPLFTVGYAYRYESLAEWQRLSGRDEHSVVADPRDPNTPLPEWAKACRKDWDLNMRSITDVDGIRDDGVRQELFRSPMAQIAIGRMLRSPYLKAVQFADPRVRGAIFEVDGQRTLALWTPHPSERRYVRLKLGRPAITVESGYMKPRERELQAGTIDVLATYNPTYLRGIGETFSESPSGVLQAHAFNLADRPVAASVVFVNEGQAPALLTVSFEPSAGFVAEPASLERSLATAETCTIPITLTPDGSVRRGTGMLRMEATLGAETIRRVAVFTVGEGDSKLPAAPGAITIDGQLDDWGTVVSERVPVATVNDASQVLAGPKDSWKGPSDLSARYYGAWTETALYLAVVVEDDTVLPQGNGLDAKTCDAVEIAFDGRAGDMQWQREWSKGCFEATVGLTADGANPDVKTNWQTPQKDVVTATALTETGYTLEMMIPLSAANYPAGRWQSERPIKLSLMILDADDSSGQANRKVLGWSVSPKLQNDRDTSGWAALILE